MPFKFPFFHFKQSKSKKKKPSSSKEEKKSSSRPANNAGQKSAQIRPAASLPPLFEISPERKLDILGTLMVLAGAFIAFSLFSFSRGSLTGTLMDGLDALLGGGTYIFPVVLFLFGLWLVLRKIERIPSISLEKVSGLILLFLCMLVFIEMFTENGGWLGRVLHSLLRENLGQGGTVVALLAWVLIALIMSFDLSLPELFIKIRPVFEKFLKLFDSVFGRFYRRRRSIVRQESPVSDGYSPIHSEVTPGALSQPEAIKNEDIAIPASIPVPVRKISWVLPSIKEILENGDEPEVNNEFVETRAKIIEETLASFGAPVKVVQVSRGPTITQFGVEPLFVESRTGRIRVRVSKIVGLSDDLALALAAPRIRIQAPVPGRSYVGIEVPNNELTLVALRDILESESFIRTRKMLSFALGKDVSGNPIGADLGGMPHLLIAGTTGSGKSVCVNAILSCLLINNTPDELRLILVDPKRVELTGYNGVPHLLAPVVVEMDRVLSALQWMTREMDRRYHTFAQVGSRNIADYNAKMKAQGQKKLPYLVIVIDELADLMMVAPEETERTITRLAQLARATGIHMILATQRPSVDVVTGLIKANFPARVAFAVSSNTDSRVILDQPGAERLLGRGDMLYQAPDAPAPARLQGVFVSDHEIHSLVGFWRKQNNASTMVTLDGAADGLSSNTPLKQVPMFEEDITAPAQDGDVLMPEAIDLIRREGRASVSMLQRKLRIGYTRAARLIDTLEERKIIGVPQDATGVRPVLDYGPAAPPKEN